VSEGPVRNAVVLLGPEKKAMNEEWGYSCNWLGVI